MPRRTIVFTGHPDWIINAIRAEIEEGPLSETPTFLFSRDSDTSISASVVWRKRIRSKVWLVQLATNSRQVVFGNGQFFQAQDVKWFDGNIEDGPVWISIREVE